MALGNPLLATWYADGTVRLYELIDGVFVQQASTGTYAHSPSAHPDGVSWPPGLDFVRDGEYLILRHAGTSAQSQLRSFDRDLILIDSELASSGQPNSALGPTAIDLPTNTSMAFHVYEPGRDRHFIGVDGVFSGGGVDSWTGSVPSENVRGLWPDPTGNFLIQGAASYANVIRRDSAGADGNGAVFAAPTFFDTEHGIDIAAWSPNGVYLFAGTKADGLSSFQNDGTNFVKVYDIPKKAGVIQAIACSRNGREVAISHNDGGTITTTIYRRSGPFLQEVQELASGFGAMIAFTADSLTMIDAQTKIGYTKSGDTWTVASGMFANVVSGVAQQAVSPHVANPVGFTKIYDDRMGDFLEGLINIDDLKITLAGSTAPAYDPTHTTLAQTVGSAELATGNWPAGGLPLGNVVGTRLGPQRYGLVADDVERILVVTGATFRYGIIYEVSTDKPLLHIDFEKVYSIPVGTKITIQFNPDGIITFGD